MGLNFLLKSLLVILCLILFSFIIFLSHKSFYSVAYSYLQLDSDMAWMMMEADRFLMREFPSFYHRIWYGGNTVGWGRALWSLIWPWPIYGYDLYQSAHLVFTFFISPLAMVLASFFLVSKFYSFKTALIIALICSLGFHQWSLRIGMDVYVGIYVFGCLLLGFRSYFNKNPFLESSFKQLFFLAILSGISLYTFRSTLLYVFVFWVPFIFIFNEFKSFLRPVNRLERALFVIFFIFLFKFLYLEMHTGELGEVFGRKIKLHAAPNLTHALIVFLVFILIKNWKPLLKNNFYYQRVFIFLIGMGLGLFPEVLYFIQEGKLAAGSLWGNNGFKEFFVLFGSLPRAFSDQVSNHLSESPLRHFSLILFYLSMGMFFWLNRNNTKMIPFFILALLVVYGFCRVKSFTPGASRYLFVLFPVFLLAIACLIEELKSKKKWLSLAFVFMLIFGHLFHQLELKNRFIQELSLTKGQEIIKKVNEVFLAENIELVVSNSYHHSNTYSFASSKRVAYFDKNNLYPKFIEARINSSMIQKGVLIYSPEDHANRNSIVTAFLNKNEGFVFLERIEDLYLYKIINK